MKTLKQIIKEAENESLTLNGFVILKPGFLKHKDDFFALLKNNDWDIIQKQEMILDDTQAKELYKMHEEKPFYKDLCKYMSSDKCICCTCHKNCKDPIKDMSVLKDKVRKVWGIDDMKNCMHSSDSLDNVNRESKICFNKINTEEE